MVDMVKSGPEWTLHETANSFTLVPQSILCVQKALTIDKVSLKATEHGKPLLTLSHFLDNISMPKECI